MNLLGLSISAYGVVIICYLGFKLVSSHFYSPVEELECEPRVSVIIPEYNEDPELLRKCLESILDQTYPIEEIHVTDDGSDTLDAWNVIQEFADAHEIIHAHRLEENQGKRHAQKEGFDKATGEVLVTVDSDTVLEPNAVEEIVKPFRNPDVNAVTGYPKIIDREASLLKRLIDMRYWTAFNVERAAQSLYGTVICCCGVLSAYRADVVHDVSDEYVNQTFLGEECTFGDDRRLTAHCLQRGKVVYQSTAQAWTDAPETIPEYLRQQTRWMRSFWRESILALGWAPRRSLLLTGMTVAEMMLPLALVFFGLGSAIYQALLGPTMAIVTYFAAVAVMAYLRNMLYSRRSASTYALSPVYGVLYLAAMLPLSFYALSTLKTTHWGTR